MVAMNVKVKEQTSRMVGVVKEKYGLKDKGEAIDKFFELNGEDLIESEIREEVVREIIESCERHVKKYGFKSMTDKELKKLFEDD